MQTNLELPNRFTLLSDKEKQFIADNWDIMGRTELLRTINRSRLRKISMNKMKCIAFRLGVFKTNSTWFDFNERTSGQGKLTEKEKWFVKQEFRKGTPKEMILQLINMTKDEKISPQNLDQFIETYVMPVKRSNKPHTFTEQELRYIRENSGKMSWQAMADELNKTRGRKISGHVLSYRVRNGLLKTI